MGFILKAGVRNKQGVNYGWFTELGTDEAANHAVDLIGYVHSSKGPAPEHWTGIKAQHWFSGPTKAALKDVAKKVSDALLNAAQSLIRR